MAGSHFFIRSAPLTLSAAAEMVGAKLSEGANPQQLISNIMPLDEAAAEDLSFLDNPAYLAQFQTTEAGACLVSPKFVSKAPAGLALLVTSEPYRAFAKLLSYFYPEATQPFGDYVGRACEAMCIEPGAHVHPTADLEANVRVEPGAVIGAYAQVGENTVISAGAIIGAYVTVGRGCSIGSGATINHAHVGNNVIIHNGVRIGQDGFGFAMGAQGHLKVPQVGRVIIQDRVEIGANTCVDRGATRDTMIGEGTKIDNLVQIGHNVVIGRHCVIVSQTGISGSATLEDYVVLGGQVGVVGHVTIGMGAQIAASSNVKDSVPAGGRWGGTPAKPVKEWFREIAAVKNLAKRGSKAVSEGAEDL